MAEFKAGDRVVKMSGTGAGKYGTVNSVAENGTLNVTFDGERLPRYCDPMRCGQVAANDKKEVARKYGEFVAEAFADRNEDVAGRRSAFDALVGAGDKAMLAYWRSTGRNSKVAVRNAKFKVGDRVVEIPSRFGSMGTGTVEWCEDDPKEPQRVRVRFDRGGTWVMDIRDIRLANAAANAKFKVGDRVVYYGKEPAIYRQRGKVSDVSRIRGETFVTVDLDSGEEWGAPEKDWAFMNAARNAKFKVGDKVKVGRDVATIVREEGDDDPSIPGEMIYLVRFVNRPGSATVAESEIKSANSRACNANVKVGDRIVLVADAGVWRKGATGAIVGGDYLPGFLYVKFDDGSEGRIPEAKMAARNAVARNDMWELEKGDRVKIKRTGETGVVTHVYFDGSISLMRDNGTGTILEARDLEWIG